MFAGRICTVFFGVTLCLAGSSELAAAPQVRLELVSQRGAPLRSQQQWLRQLAEVGVTNLRIRSRQSQDEIGIRVEGSGERTVYLVTGLLDDRGQVVLRGARFRPGEAARLSRWLDELARKGPQKEHPKTVAFGLTARQYERLHQDLARRLDFSTKGITRRELFDRLLLRMRLPLRIGVQLPEALGRVKLSEELQGLSCGTVLAYTLRPLGLCLVPRPTGADTAECTVSRTAAGIEAWPVGWPPEKPRRDVLPVMFEFLTVNVQGTAVSKTLDEIGKRLEVPILIDSHALARRGIEPEKINAEVPHSRTTYSLLLRKVLFQAKLKSELRVDEAGHPLLWVTTIKPVGKRNTKPAGKKTP